MGQSYDGSQSHDFDVNERVAFISGGASGIGAAVAEGLASLGATVVIADIDSDAAQATVARIRATDGWADSCVVDVTDSSSVTNAVAEVLNANEKIDILVNAAGTISRLPAEDLSVSEFSRVVDVNLTGVFRVCQAVGVSMLTRQSGSIINISSIGAFRAYPNASAYLASKAGVSHLTRALALEWLARGVRVNAIAPGLVDTPMAEQGADSATAQFIRSRMLAEPILDPKDLIGTVLFLASAASRPLTGQTISCDDGYLLA